MEDPPTISGPTMYVASDHSGTNKKSRYVVTAIVCADLEASTNWEVLRRKVRTEYLRDGRRMAYKALNDVKRAKAFVPFLSAAEYIHGLCLVIIINKSVRHLCLNNVADYKKLRTAAGLRARWKDQELESMLRTTHFIGCLSGGLSQLGINVYWISDEDNIFADPLRQHDVARMLSIYSSHYVKHSLGELGIGTTSLDEGDRFEEDFAVVADLAAGGIAEIFTTMANDCGGRIPVHLAVERNRPFLPKADLISRWFWLGKSNLRRVAILFEDQPEGISCSRYQMLSVLTETKAVISSEH